MGMIICPFIASNTRKLLCIEVVLRMCSFNHFFSLITKSMKWQRVEQLDFSESNFFGSFSQIPISFRANIFLALLNLMKTCISCTPFAALQINLQNCSFGFFVAPIES